YPTYHDETVQKVLRNAVKWAHTPQSAYTRIHQVPHVPIEKALEPIVDRGPNLEQ
ncbi:trehalose utilization protein ThuA, partial [Mesorhizobium sp. M5C.F.Ca.IN.020.29.1.1]